MTDDELIILWHTDETANNLAHEFGIKQQTLIMHWRRLKNEGKLPQRVRQISDWGQRQPDRGYDGRPSVGDYEDPLLMKLFEIHPEKAP